MGSSINDVILISKHLALFSHLFSNPCLSSLIVLVVLRLNSIFSLVILHFLRKLFLSKQPNLLKKLKLETLTVSTESRDAQFYKSFLKIFQWYDRYLFFFFDDFSDFSWALVHLFVFHLTERQSYWLNLKGKHAEINRKCQTH